MLFCLKPDCKTALNQHRRLRVAVVGLLSLQQVVEREHHVGSFGIPTLPASTRIGPFFFFCVCVVVGGGRGGCSSIHWSSLAMMPGMERSRGIMSQGFL